MHAPDLVGAVEIGKRARHPQHAESRIASAASRINASPALSSRAISSSSGPLACALVRIWAAPSAA